MKNFQELENYYNGNASEQERKDFEVKLNSNPTFQAEYDTYIASQNLIEFIISEDLKEKLSEMNFCRGNKGYLINLQHVDRIQDGCALVKGENLTLSRARRKVFMEALTRYWGEVIK